MKATLSLASTYISADEGGFLVSASEPGGACNMGISLLVYQEYCAHYGYPKPTTDDLKRMKPEEARAIYARYAENIRYEELPAGVDYVLLNIAVMQGIHGAHMILQEALFLEINSDLTWHDNMVWATMMATPPRQLVSDLLFEQACIKMRAPNVGPHKDAKTGEDAHGAGPGWADRMKRVRLRAQPMIS